MAKKNKILLPDGTYMERLYEKALVMEAGYQERYEQLLMENTREGMVLVYIHSNMNENGELISDLGTIAEALTCSKATVARAVSLFKEKFADLVTVDKFHGISKFVVDTTRCFKA